MRKRSALAAVLIAASVLAAAAAARGVHSTAPTKLTIWVGWSAGHELTSFQKLIDEYNRTHKNVSVKVVGGIDDNKIVAAIRSGTAPDVVSTESRTQFWSRAKLRASAWISCWSSLPEGPTAIRKVVGRSRKNAAPIMAAKNRSPAASSRNGELRRLGGRVVVSAASFEGSEDDIITQTRHIRMRVPMITRLRAR